MRFRLATLPLFLVIGCTHPGAGSDSVVEDSDTSDTYRDTWVTTDTSDTSGTSDTSTALTPVARSMWVWDTSVAGDVTATEALLAFAEANGVTTLFLSCDPVGYGSEGAEERYHDFVQAAHAADVEVYGMSGYSWFSVPCDAGLAGQPTCWEEGWAVYEACAASNVGFDGIMDDTEPASTPEGSWFTDHARRAAWHLEYLEGIRARIGDLPFHHAIPAWYDEEESVALGDTGALETLDVWIAGVVDVVGVMSYRDTASAILDIAASELEGGPVWIGVETAPSSEGEHITFAEEGASALSAALDEMEAEVGTHPNLRGFMVDAYESWRELGTE